MVISEFSMFLLISENCYYCCILRKLWTFCYIPPWVHSCGSIIDVCHV